MLFLLLYIQNFACTHKTIINLKNICSCDIHIKLHSHQTADQPPTNADQFLWLGRVWSGKKLPALIEERIYPRSTPAASALYPWCIHAQIPLFPTYPRSYGWPIPALHDQLPTYSWYNYAHYAQYRTNRRSDNSSKSKGIVFVLHWQKRDLFYICLKYSVFLME